MTMKRSVILLFSLVCVLFSSCQKAPKDYLLGMWEITSSSGYINGEPVAEAVYYWFKEDGVGSIYTGEDIAGNPPAELSSGWKDKNFTYVFDRKENTILIETFRDMKFLWVVDELTDDSLTCHSATELNPTVLHGKKLK